MKIKLFTSLAIIVVAIGFIIQNIDGLIYEKSTDNSSSLAQINIMDQTGMYITIDR